MGTIAKISFVTVSIGLGYLVVAQLTGVAPPARPLTAAEVQAHTAPAVPKPPAWDYSTDTDEMGRGTITHAMLQSTNAVTFRWPYGGPQRGTLQLRRHPTYGKDVILRLTRAHFLCHTYDDSCGVTVRIDNGKPQRFQAAPPTDHSTDTLFIRGYDRLVPQLKKAKTLRIEALFYQDGLHVFEFNVEGLAWATPAAAKAPAPAPAKQRARPSITVEQIFPELKTK